MTRTVQRPWITAFKAGSGEGKSAMLVSTRLFQLASVQANKDLCYVVITKDKNSFRESIDKGFRRLSLTHGLSVVAPQMLMIDINASQPDSIYLEIASAIASLGNRSVLIIDSIEEVDSIYPLEERVLNAEISCLEIIMTTEGKGE